MSRLYLVLIYLLVPSIVLADEIKSFTTDGCNSFPNGTLKQQSLWVNCSIRHDLTYWKGGSYVEKLESDKALKTCVAKVGEPEIASIMIAGIRIGGSPYSQHPTAGVMAGHT